MTVTDEQAGLFQAMYERIVERISTAILGKRDVVELTVACMLSGGHLLLEDVPGTGKTSLAKALAAAVVGSYKRIQFTPDMLPSDVTGVEVFDPNTRRFEFQKGPIFHTIVLADEINRASPKTQSALLEVMEEGHVTIAGTEHTVGKPFMVIATQNPIEQAGTYPLPEAQLDRFLMRTNLGYPDHDSMIHLLREAANRDRSAKVSAAIGENAVQGLTELADQVYVGDDVLGYINRITVETRAHKHVRLGVSVRGCLSLVRCAKTWALAHGWTQVRPDDVLVLVHPVLEHRMLLTPDAMFDSRVSISDVLAEAIEKAGPPPQDRGHARGY